MVEFKCEICNREFKDADALTAHNRAKHPEKGHDEKSQPLFRKIKGWLIFILIFGLTIAGIIFTISNIKTLPPTDMNGHVESNPASHVLKEPMPIAIQKHMLEHADGTGRSGVIINYNCENYECEEGLIENLESFAAAYDYVYVAPFRGMDAKIVLTRPEKIEVLDEYDKERINNFIIGF